MKKTLLLVAALVLISMSSCSPYLYDKGRNVYVSSAKTPEEARMRAGATNMSYRHENGVLVQKSLYNEVVFSVDCGWIKVENTPYEIKVSHGGTTTVISKQTPSK